jgi:hypothetical protein
MAAADNISVLSVQAIEARNRPRKFPAADSELARSLATSVAESIAVPGTGATAAVYVRIAATADIYASFTTTATVPGDVTDGTASELLAYSKGEHWYYCKGVTNISVITGAAGGAVVTASFYV